MRSVKPRSTDTRNGNVIIWGSKLLPHDMRKDFIMYDIKEFTNEQFGGLTAIEIDNEPWFIGKQVTEALGYDNSSKALKDHVDDEDKIILKKAMFGDNNETLLSIWTNEMDLKPKTFINESGLYSLVLGSKLPSAKDFKHWVTSEVLPSIRKHGMYATDEVLQKAIDDPDWMIGLLTQLKRNKLNNYIEV